MSEAISWPAAPTRDYELPGLPESRSVIDNNFLSSGLSCASATGWWPYLLNPRFLLEFKRDTGISQSNPKELTCEKLYEKVWFKPTNKVTAEL